MAQPYQQPVRGAPPQPYQAPRQATGSGGGTPWGKVAAGIGGLVVVVVVGVAVALAASDGDGGEDPPTEPVVVRTTEPVTEPEETEPQPYVYERLLDDTGTITVDAPRPWTDTDGGPWVEDGNEIGRQIVAAPDLEAFRNSWNVPGVIFGVSEQLAETFTPDTLLDAFSFANQCTYDGRTDYSDQAYSGVRDDYSDCGGTDTDYTLVAAQPPVSEDVLLLVQFQEVDELDEEALDRALETFFILPESTEAEGS